MMPRVVTNVVEFQGELYEIVRIDYDNKIASLRRFVSEGESPAETIDVHVTDFTIKLHGRIA